MNIMGNNGNTLIYPEFKIIGMTNLSNMTLKAIETIKLEEYRKMK